MPQKEVLRKVGGPPGQNQFYYNLVKSLLERIAPVMIDSAAVKELVSLVGELLTGAMPLADMVENAAEKGIKLLQVSLVFHSVLWGKHQNRAVSETPE